MRIAINCRSFLKKNYTGIGRYAHNLVTHLSEIDRENEYCLYVQKRFFDPQRRVPRIPAKNFSVKLDWFNRGPGKTLGKVDVYHSPSPDFIHVPGAKIIVTVHDLIYKTYPQGHTPQTCATTDQQLHAIVKQADRIICCSQSTGNDLKKFFDVDEQRIRLIYQGVDKSVFYPLNDEERKGAHSVLQKQGIDQPFLLFVGTIEPRKNLLNVLAACAILKEKKKFDGKLVVAGMKGWLSEGLKEVIGNLKLEEDIIFLGYVTDEELRCLYNLAEVFVFPSFYEGFGFPIVEALSCSAAVVTSNVSSCPEIAGDAALTVEPDNPEDIAGAIGRILQDNAFKVGLQQKAIERAKHFSFRRTAQQTLKVYEEVL